MAHEAAATIKRMRAAYDLIAPLYPGVNGAMPPDVKAMALRVVQHAGPRSLLLDVGCGPGRHMAWFEARGVPSVGVDLSRGMLLHARRLVRGAVVQMDMRRLCFADATFGAVWCCASLLHLPRSEAPGVLRELRRVLLRDGICFLAVQEGSGEGWERRGRYGSVERLFTRYRRAEMADLLAGSGLDVFEEHQADGGSVSWLQYLARAGPRPRPRIGHE